MFFSLSSFAEPSQNLFHLNYIDSFWKHKQIHTIFLNFFSKAMYLVIQQMLKMISDILHVCQ